MKCIMNVSIYTLTSPLHDEQAVNAVTRDFLEHLGIDYTLKGADFSDYGESALSLIFVRTGGTEGLFRQLLPTIIAHSAGRPIYLLTSGKSNSLAASMEILSFLRQQGISGEILHGSSTYIAQRITLLEQVGKALKHLRGCRLGIIGQPSDWLIASEAKREKVLAQTGIELVDIDMEDLLDTITALPEQASEETALSDETVTTSTIAAVREALPGAERIYRALKKVVGQHELNGFTLRCFDLLSAVKNTGCLALARMNAEGIIAGCEGDVPAMITMTIAQALTGSTGFQANPSAIDPETGTLLFAHCTIPLNMVRSYELDTHFESGIGVGIRGYVDVGPVTIFKLSGDLQRYFIAEGELIKNQHKPDLCRTQLVLSLSDNTSAAYFLNNPIGNHHIILKGHHGALLKEACQAISQPYDHQ